MEPKKTGRRIVSKGTYVVIQTRRAGTGFSAICLLFFAAGCGAITVFLCYAVTVVMVALMGGLATIMIAAIYWLLLLIFGYATFQAVRVALSMLRHAVKIDPGIPLTRANTETLPVPESLVRASTKPVQAQVGMLVRVATQGQQAPPEQLVRPVKGKE